MQPKNEVENNEIEEDLDYDYMQKISISLPSNIVNEIQKRAKKEHRKRSQIIAQNLEKAFFEEHEELDYGNIDERLRRIESRQRSMLRSLTLKGKDDLERPIDKQKILKMIEDCTSEVDEGFEIESSEGFKQLCQERELIDDVWIDDHIKLIVPYLKIGYDGYFSKPKRDEFINEIAEAMQLNEKQKKILSEEFEKLFQENQDEWEEEE